MHEPIVIHAELARGGERPGSAEAEKLAGAGRTGPKTIYGAVSEAFLGPHSRTGPSKTTSTTSTCRSRRRPVGSARLHSARRNDQGHTSLLREIPRQHGRRFHRQGRADLNPPASSAIVRWVVNCCGYHWAPPLAALITCVAWKLRPCNEPGRQPDSPVWQREADAESSPGGVGTRSMILDRGLSTLLRSEPRDGPRPTMPGRDLTIHETGKKASMFKRSIGTRH